MRADSLFIAVLLFFSLLLGCTNRDDSIDLLSQEKPLLLPLKASAFFGYFLKEDLKVGQESSNGDVIRFLNFPRFKAVIADGKTVNRLKKITSNWVPLCLVALKGDKRYFLVVKRELLKEPTPLIKLVKGWNYGVELLKDPAVVYYLTGKRELRAFKFLACEGRDEVK